MSSLLQRFSLRSIKFNSPVIAILLALWIVILVCAVSSIISQPFTKRQRIFWLVLVVCFPLVGLLAYLPFSFKRDDLPQLTLAKAKKKKKHGLDRGGGSDADF